MATQSIYTSTQTGTSMPGIGCEALAVDRYVGPILELFPPGYMWPRDVTGDDIAKLARVIGRELSRWEKLGYRMLEEMDPRTALITLEWWERLLDLPDADGADQSVEARQRAAHQRYTQVGGQSPDFFIELCAKLGYTVEVEQVSRTHGMHCGDGSVCGEGKVCGSDVAAFQVIFHTKAGPDDPQLVRAIARQAHEHIEEFVQYDLP